jgi:hypothetical protein
MQRKRKPTRKTRFAAAARTAPLSSWTSLTRSARIAVLPIVAAVASAQPSMAAGSKQVVYQTEDGHVHELSKTTDGSWQHADLTQLTGAPPTGIKSWGAYDASPVGYGWDAGASKQVVYWGNDAHVHELYFIRGGQWKHADLTQRSRAPVPVDSEGNPLPWGPLSAYAWEAGKSKQVVYLTENGHINELCISLDGGGCPHYLGPFVSTEWQHLDLTNWTLAPEAEIFLPGGPSPCALSGYAWEKGRSKQVAYITSDGHIREVYFELGGVPTKRWVRADLTARIKPSYCSGTQAPKCDGPTIDSHRVENNACRFQGYGWNRWKQVAYQANDDIKFDAHIIGEIYAGPADWSYGNLSFAAGLDLDPCIFSTAYAWEAGGSKQVVCKDRRDSHIFELYTWGGTWRSVDLTELTGAPTPISSQVLGYSWEAGKSKQVVYTTRDGHIQELSVGLDGGWQHKDLMTEVTGEVPPAPADGSLLSAFGWNLPDPPRRSPVPVN